MLRGRCCRVLRGIRLAVSTAVVKGCVVGQACKFKIFRYDFNHSANFTHNYTCLCLFKSELGFWYNPVWQKVVHSCGQCRGSLTVTSPRAIMVYWVSMLKLKNNTGVFMFKPIYYKWRVSSSIFLLITLKSSTSKKKRTLQRAYSMKINLHRLETGNPHSEHCVWVLFFVNVASVMEYTKCQLTLFKELPSNSDQLWETYSKCWHVHFMD